MHTEEEQYVIIEGSENCYALRVSLKELINQPMRVNELPTDEQRTLLMQLPALQTALAAALVTAQAEERRSGDRLLTVEEAAAKLSCTKDYLYRNSKRFPFTKRNGRALRFSEQELERYIREWMGAGRL